MFEYFTFVNAVTLLVGLWFLRHGYRQGQHSRESVPVFLTSLVLGLGLIFVAVFQDSFVVVASVLGIEQKGRAILIVSNLTLFVVVTLLFSRLTILYNRLSMMNEDLALLRARVDASDDASTAPQTDGSSEPEQGGD